MRPTEMTAGRCLLACALVTACAANGPPAVSVTAKPIAPNGPPQTGAALPLANLDVATRFPDLPAAPQSQYLNVVGGRLVLQSYGTFFRPPPMEAASFDVVTGTRTVTFAPVGPLNPTVSLDGAELFLRPAGDVLVGMMGGSLVAFDPATGARRWATLLYDGGALARMQPTASPLNHVWPAAVSATRETAFALVEEGHSLGGPLQESVELVAVDAASGALRWRAPIGAFDVLHEPDLRLYVVGDVAVVRSNRSLQAFSGGRQAWHGEAGDGALLADATTMVALESDSFHTIDPTTGEVGPKHTGPTTAAALDGGVLYAWARADSGIALEATRVADGSRLWRSPAVPMLRSDEWADAPIASGDAVYACAGGSFRAFERSSGVLAYAYGLGGCGILGIAPTASRHDPAIVVLANGGVRLSFARTAEAHPPQPIHVSGVVSVECGKRAGERVIVDDVVVTTDAHGRYDATVPARGLVHLETAPHTELVVSKRITPYDAFDAKDLPPDDSSSLRGDFDVRLRPRCIAQFSYEPQCAPARSSCAPER